LIEPTLGDIAKKSFLRDRGPFEVPSQGGKGYSLKYPLKVLGGIAEKNSVAFGENLFMNCRIANVVKR
jgi:hypothetical protein